MLSYTDAENDPRVVMASTLAARLGYRVETFGAALGREPGRTARDGARVTLLPIMSAYRPRAVFRALADLARGRIEASGGGSRRSNALSLILFNLWVLRLGLGRKPDIVHCHEHQPLLSAWIAARLRRAKLVYDAHENTTVNRADKGMKGRLAIAVEGFFLTRADAVVTVGERLAGFLRERGAKRVVVIGNWKQPDDYRVDEARLSSLRRELGLPEGALVVSYIGSLAPERQIEPLLAAAAASPGVHLVIGGRGPLEARVLQAAREHSNIHWLGWVPLERVPDYTGLADAIYYCLESNSGNLYYSTPNKLFDAFAAGKAVIARRGYGEIGDILERVDAAVLLDDVAPDSIARAFDLLQDEATRRQLQRNAAAAARQYNWDVAAERLGDLYEELLTR